MKTQIFERAIVSAGVLALLALLLPSAAWAQGNAWYVAGGLGASFVDDVDATQAGVTLTTELDTGIFATGAFGRTFGNFRAEGELAYNTNDVSTLSVPGVGGVTASGDISTLGLMVNGYYDFETNSKWRPYIGGGIGGANVSINSLSSLGVLIADDDTTVFAYQVKVGVAYEFTQALAGTLGYRFFATEDADFVDLAGAAFSTDGIEAHIVELGVRFRF